VNAGDPYVVWMANKLWEAHSVDRSMIAELQRYARILWVDPPISPATRAHRRFGAARTARPHLSAMSDTVTRLTTTALPGLRRPGVRVTTAPLLRAQVRWALRRTGIEPSALVSTSLEDVLGCWGSGVVSALYGTDDYVAGAELMRMSASWLRAQERRAVADADVVLALSPLLARRWSALRGRPVPVIPNGCTPVRASAHRLPPAIRDLPRPVVGLIGKLNGRINVDLVEAIADAGFSLLLVGPHDSRWEPQRFCALTGRPGVRYVGPVKAAEVPSYIAAIDVGITPYLDSPFNRASFPIKTLDYLAAGRAAVSTALPAARWLLDDLTRGHRELHPGQILALANDRAGFVDAVRHIVGDPAGPAHAGRSGPDGRGLRDRESAHADRCRAFAARHTWSRRADSLAALIGLTGTVASQPCVDQLPQPGHRRQREDAQPGQRALE
jgi:teichuronic acid biosynthesis glycosyltransferase TuaH